jgi:hypothetical protein
MKIQGIIAYLDGIRDGACFPIRSEQSIREAERATSTFEAMEAETMDDTMPSLQRCDSYPFGNDFDSECVTSVNREMTFISGA